MSRIRLCFATVLVAAIGTQLDVAAQPPAAAQPPKVAAGAPALPPQVLDAKIEKGSLIIEVYHQVPVEKTINVQEVVNGKAVAVQRKVVSFEIVPMHEKIDLKKTKATDVNGKPIPADKLADMLKEMTPIVASDVPVAPKYRKMFKDTVVFMELPPPEPLPAPAPPKPELKPKQN